MATAWVSRSTLMGAIAVERDLVEEAVGCIIVVGQSRASRPAESILVECAGVSLGVRTYVGIFRDPSQLA
jgi:hypothetical protein